MIGTGVTVGDLKKDPRFQGRKDYANMANEVMKAKEAKEAAAAGKEKVAKEDKGAIGELGKLEKKVDTDARGALDDDKKPEIKEKKPEIKEKKPAAKEEAKPEAKPEGAPPINFMPPELTMGSAPVAGAAQTTVSSSYSAEADDDTADLAKHE